MNFWKCMYADRMQMYACTVTYRLCESRFSRSHVSYSSNTQYEYLHKIQKNFKIWGMKITLTTKTFEATIRVDTYAAILAGLIELALVYVNVAILALPTRITDTLVVPWSIYTAAFVTGWGATRQTLVCVHVTIIAFETWLALADRFAANGKLPDYWPSGKSCKIHFLKTVYKILDASLVISCSCKYINFLTRYNHESLLFQVIFSHHFILQQQLVGS